MEDYDEPLCEFQEYYWEDDFYQLNQREADDYRNEFDYDYEDDDWDDFCEEDEDNGQEQE